MTDKRQGLKPSKKFYNFKWLNFARGGRIPAFALLAAALFLQISDPQFLSSFRDRIFDVYQQSHPREAQFPRPVVVIDIDENSLLNLGQWPWPRSYLAKLVENTTKSGAAVIGFDMLFAESDRLSPNEMSQNIVGLPPLVQRQLSTLPSFDGIFAEAIENSRVVLGISVSPESVGANNLGLDRIPSFALLGQDPKPFLRNYPALIGNIDKLDDAASGRGMISLDQDFDGIVRRIPLANRIGDKIIPSLALDMLRVATGRNVIIQTNENGIVGFKVAGTLVPTDTRGRIWLKYAQYDPTLYISALDVINGTVDEELLAGKLVLVGTSATGLKDLRASPLTSNLPGVEMHLQLLENIWSQSYLFRPDFIAIFEWTGTLMTGLSLIILVPLAGARATLGLLVFISVTAIGSSAYFFVYNSVLIDVSYTLFISILVYITMVYANYRGTEQERTRIRTAFAHYLSPELVKRLSASPDSLVLGGEEREMTFMFCDVREFTVISEGYKHDPQGLTHLINRFLTPMTSEILKHNGTIDKYMGDSIMAFWNAPLENDQHRKDAADAALQMIVRLAALNAELREEAERENRAFKALRVGIGLNTGVCIVGNLGSEQRFDYSVLGDPVNLASRLEGQTKEYGFSIILGESTATAIPDYAMIELDLIAVKGKQEAVKIFGLLGNEEHAKRTQFIEAKEAIETFLSLYFSKNWDEALNKLNFIESMNPRLEKFVTLYRDRIRTFTVTPPPTDWDGVFRATRK
ncbi:adenylate/guanylate cyclase domain-containing protein [Sneathiella sp. CAU 1612]|uniref:Adenylate/guanylate cyclase domain-containing protein n=1 Tax=Sneathiella sedimenti TaxID=2816034 RepID=A0ABS3FA50_9PROT|nr:adenylate/guanylate cyclase domain-containing protein [Sneathiella sedimenti]MBO0335259.1 adenylate/guanylate cyclase domain-containing protein [Sneathiella sedimenti]